jgi:quinolinate synthase
MTTAQVTELQAQIKDLAREKNAVILAHNYERPRCRTSPISSAIHSG